MIAVYTILVIVVSCVSVVSTYFLLNAEDHRWAWHAFASGASTALYVFLYGCFWFVFRSEMTGLLQTAFYFGYTALACTALGLMTGAVGVAAASTFVRAIFQCVLSPRACAVNGCWPDGVRTRARCLNTAVCEIPFRPIHPATQLPPSLAPACRSIKVD